jgi:lipopolysaccharide biosynthesis protein
MPAAPVCLFAQYDPSGRIAPHVLRYLAHLAECGFVVHVACSGATRLAEDDKAALRQIGATPHPRVNAGLDFGAWQELLRTGCAEGAPEVLLANDSVFGPFADLRPLLAAMRARRLDAWGMVASTEGVWHLQSWFVCLSARALAAPAVQRVLAQPFAEMSKPEIILHGELGLGTALREAKLATGAAFEEPRRNRLRRLVRVNPMHLDWAWLLTSGHVPFLKIELLRDNPIGIPWAHRWPAVLAGTSDYPPELIRRHLGRATPLPPVPWRTRLLYLLLTRDKSEAIRALAPTLSGRAK